MSERVRPDHPSDKNSRQLAGLWRRAPQLTCALPNRGEGVLQNNLQSAANEFLEALSGDLDPKWTEVWAHISLGTIFDITGQSDRAVNEYKQARRTGDNTFGAQEEVARLLKELGADTTLSARIFGRRPLVEPVEKVPADYTDEARIAELEGTVLLEGVIGEDGAAYDLTVVQPLGLGLDERAIDAVRRLISSFRRSCLVAFGRRDF